MDEKTKTPSELEALTKRIENLEMWLLAAKYMVGGYMVWEILWHYVFSRF